MNPGRNPSLWSALQSWGPFGAVSRRGCKLGVGEKVRVGSCQGTMAAVSNIHASVLLPPELPSRPRPPYWSVLQHRSRSPWAICACNWWVQDSVLLVCSEPLLQTKTDIGFSEWTWKTIDGFFWNEIQRHRILECHQSYFPFLFL